MKGGRGNCALFSVPPSVFCQSIETGAMKAGRFLSFFHSPFLFYDCRVILAFPFPDC